MWKDAKALIEEIEHRKNRGNTLEHFKNYMESIGNPHKDIKAIHIAGTNGKGSTTNYIRSILQSAGYKTGSFTSPYIITHRDRIRINDIYISEEKFVEIAQQYYDSWMKWDLSMFEIDMVIACIWFKEQQVDVAVFETGLGGRLDFTNILTPMVSVITNIGMDHMELLGDTYEKIAEEKAGIIKEGIDVITAERKEECLHVFFQHAKNMKSTCICTEEVIPVWKDKHLYFNYKGYRDIALSTKAEYQCSNAALALETIFYLHEHKKLHVTQEQMRKGLYEAVWIGRFEVLREEPLFIIDGAHNSHGIKALCNSLKGIQDIQVIFSVLKDKNFEEMLQQLETITKDITVCPFMNARALDIHILENRPHITVKDSYEIAIQEALKKEKPIVVTGSLYFISEVRKWIYDTGLLNKEKSNRINYL